MKLHPILQYLEGQNAFKIEKCLKNLQFLSIQDLIVNFRQGKFHDISSIQLPERELAHQSSTRAPTQRSNNHDFSSLLSSVSYKKRELSHYVIQFISSKQSTNYKNRNYKTKK